MEPGPELIRADLTPKRQRLLVAGAGGLVIAVIAGLMVWRGLNPLVAAVAFIATYVVLLYTNFSLSIRAGADWIAYGHAHVFPARLVEVRARTLVAGTRVYLEDDTGQKIEPYLENLAANDEIWRLLSDGVAISRARGLELDAATGRLFPG